MSLPQSEVIKALQAANGVLAAAARTLGVPKSTLASAIDRDPLLATALEDSRAQHAPDPATVLDDVDAAELGDMDQLLRDRGMVPEDWIVEGVVVNEWGPVDQLQRQLKVRLAPRADVLRPADPVCPVIPIRPAVARKGPVLWAVCSDHHAPYYDRGLHACWLQFLRDVKPDRGALLGDTLDLPNISRFMDNPPFDATPQECVDSAFVMLRDYRLASKGTRWVKLKGNHDDRIRKEQLLKAERLHALRPADNGVPQKDPHCVGTLLHLDELNIEFVRTVGGYESGRLQITPLLGARHGKKTGPNSGAKTLERITYSTLHGHTHIKRDAWQTRWGMNGLPEVLRATEIGTMAMIVDGLGHSDDPNWTQGGATVSVWPDGQYAIDHLVYTGGSLFWRDRRWDADASVLAAAA